MSGAYRAARAAAAAGLVLLGACAADGRDSAAEWCDRLKVWFAASDDDADEQLPALLERAPNEIHDIVGPALGLEGAEPLPSDVSLEEAEARVDEFLNERCTELFTDEGP